MSPRIGILGASTFPSENEQYMSNSNLNASGPLVSQQNMEQSGYTNLGAQYASGRIDDVSSSVNK
jgi:hypothetical protein